MPSETGLATSVGAGLLSGTKRPPPPGTNAAARIIVMPPAPASSSHSSLRSTHTASSGSPCDARIHIASSSSIASISAAGHSGRVFTSMLICVTLHSQKHMRAKADDAQQSAAHCFTLALLECVSSGTIHKFEWIFRQFKEELRRLNSAKSRGDDAEMAERHPKLRTPEFLRHTLRQKYRSSFFEAHHNPLTCPALKIIFSPLPYFALTTISAPSSFSLPSRFS